MLAKLRLWPPHEQIPKLEGLVTNRLKAPLSWVAGIRTELDNKEGVVVSEYESPFHRSEENALENFTVSKTRLVSASRFSMALVFAFCTTYLLYAPRGPLYYWQLTFLVGLTLLSAAYPVAWILFPHRHPVYRALTAHGDARSIAERLDGEMARVHKVLEPFHFTASLLVYSPGTPSCCSLRRHFCRTERIIWRRDSVPVILVNTKDGRTYKWHRTWIQGTFDADQVLLSIRDRANLTRTE